MVKDSEFIKYKSLNNVGKDFIEILKKNKSTCSHKDFVIGNEKLRVIRCRGEKENLSILYYPDTGEIHEIINMSKAWRI